MKLPMYKYSHIHGTSVPAALARTTPGAKDRFGLGYNQFYIHNGLIDMY